METFELEFETVPNEGITTEVLEAAQSLAESAADLLDQTVEGYAAEYEAAAVTSDLNGTQALSNPAFATPTDAEVDQPLSVAPHGRGSGPVRNRNLGSEQAPGASQKFIESLQ